MQQPINDDTRLPLMNAPCRRKHAGGSAATKPAHTPRQFSRGNDRQFSSNSLSEFGAHSANKVRGAGVILTDCRVKGAIGAGQHG
jgi:hypothetical protein